MLVSLRQSQNHKTLAGISIIGMPPSTLVFSQESTEGLAQCPVLTTTEKKDRLTSRSLGGSNCDAFCAFSPCPIYVVSYHFCSRCALVALAVQMLFWILGAGSRSWVVRRVRCLFSTAV
jgi:hypothetical protein